MILPCRAALVAALCCSPALSAPADDIVASLQARDPALAAVLTDVLQRHPEIAAARARALASAQVAPQVRSLPDPWLELGAFPISGDGRQGSLEVEQEVPGAGKRRLGAEAALLDAAAADADVEAARLRLVTEARELWLSVAGLDAVAGVLHEERVALEQFEGLARARYESGEGMQHDVVRLQAQITRTERDLLDLESERLLGILSLNALRGLPGRMELASPALPAAPAPLPPASLLQSAARALRPELAAAQSRLLASSARTELARRGRRPDFMLRGGWMLMQDMEEKGGALGGDEIMLGVGIRLPVRSRRIVAEIEQAVQEQQASQAERDAQELAIERDVAELAARHELLARRLASDDVLGLQAAEMRRSAEEAYASGLAGSLETLEATREDFEIRRDVAATLAEMSRIEALLEGRLGAPLSALMQGAPR